jgi:hypothetical protein
MLFSLKFKENLMLRQLNRYLHILRWKLTSERQKQARLNEIVRLLDMVPETRALLQWAREDNIQISLQPDLGTAGATYYPGSSQTSHSIKISTTYRPADAAAVAAHELRHYWQHKKLQLIEQDLKPQDKDPLFRFIFNRVLEADAYTFEWRYKKMLDEKVPSIFAQSKEADQSFLRNEDDAFLYFLVLPSMVFYDVKAAKQLYFAYAFNTAAAPDNTVTSDLDTADIRNLLKVGITDDAPSYFTSLPEYDLDSIPDDKFGQIILNAVNKEALKVVPLIEKFKAAVNGHDSQTIETLRRELKRVVSGLPTYN